MWLKNTMLSAAALPFIKVRRRAAAKNDHGALSRSSSGLAMSSAVQEPIQVELAPGDLLAGTHRTALWRLHSGALRMHDADPAGIQGLIGVALPGDLIGVECLVGELPSTSLRALIRSRLVLLGQEETLLAPHSASAQPDLLVQALVQSRRQGRDNMRLRAGPVAERVKCLLLMLSDPGKTTGCLDDVEIPCALPSLRDMAMVVDSAPETVSRVLGSLRRLDVLHDRKPKSVSFNRIDLDQTKAVPGMTSSSVPVSRTRPVSQNL
jgi:CRP-like cAMP-binding protein